jgi:CDP-glucose 4,6-dehydratase
VERLFRGFYQGKRVLVTGHTGFKGSWLSLWLLQLGATVAGFSAYLPSEPCNFEILGLEHLLAHYVGDIRDYQQLSQVFQDFQPQVVFHLAAQPIVRRSYGDPKLTFDTNLGGTVNILECIRQSRSVEVAVIITSDKCYKNVEWLWGYRENDALGGDDPYSASKGGAELAVNSYCQCYFESQGSPQVASVRAGNVIGGGDWAEDRLVPDCVRAWSGGQQVFIRDPQATRPWQHVLEPLSGYLWLGVRLGQERQLSGEAFNFGPKAEVIQSVQVLVSTFEKYWANVRWQRQGQDTAKKESRLLKLCCDKALALLGWQAMLSFEETIDFTATWYKRFYEGRTDMLEFSIQQIKAYGSLARRRGAPWHPDND